MENYVKTCLMVLLVLFSLGCSTDKSKTSETDSVETAEESNEARNDSVGSDMVADSHQESSEFLVKAASGGLMEVELGKMVQQKGSNAGVKSFAKQMVADHGKANEELKTLAASKNITIPATPGEDHQKHITEMQKLSGAELDRHYMDMMVKDHEEDIELFEDAAESNAIDPAVKTFAQKTLPVLKKHHELARQTNDKIKK